MALQQPIQMSPSVGNRNKWQTPPLHMCHPALASHVFMCHHHPMDGCNVHDTEDANGCGRGNAEADMAAERHANNMQPPLLGGGGGERLHVKQVTGKICTALAYTCRSSQTTTAFWFCPHCGFRINSDSALVQARSLSTVHSNRFCPDWFWRWF